MIHASLFSGIGGPEVAAAMLGWENAFHCEINPFGRAVLEYWFPNSESYEDITKTSFRKWRGRIDVITGGFPCQPFSYAGRRGGADDNRYLWPEMLRVIDEVRPAWVVGENVAGLSTMVEGGVLTDMGCDPVMFGEGDGLHRYELRQRFTIERICSDLEGLGYAVQPMLIPAAAVGAPHRRDRIFIVAHVADTYGGDDVRESGIFSRESGKERLQERDAIREPGVAGELRSEVQGALEDSERVRWFRGVAQGQSDSGGQRMSGTGDNVRICGEERSDAPHTQGGGSREIPSTIHARVADGNESVCDGRIRTASDAYCPRREEPLFSGRQPAQAKAGAGVHNRVERPCGDGEPSDTLVTGLEREDESRHSEGGERVHIRRDAAGYDWATDGELGPAERWTEFPTVSPVHRGNDGLPFPLDDLTIPATKWRTESLKAYGNAIVPQVMYRIFQAIEKIEFND